MLPFKMAKTVTKSLFRKPATLMYPVVTREFTKNTRGKIDIDINTCIFCGICQKKCPTGAISVSRPDKQWEIERMKCITCNYCVDSCPKKCLSMGNHYTAPNTTKNKDVYKDARVPDNTANS